VTRLSFPKLTRSDLFSREFSCKQPILNYPIDIIATAIA
jgi:hypothetical protein